MEYLRERYVRPWPPLEPPPERRAGDWRFVAGLALAMLLVAMGFGFGLIAAASARTIIGAPAAVTSTGTPTASGLAPAAATTTAAASATLTPTASASPATTTTPGATTTASPGPAGLISGAYLGGTQDAFTAAYGQPSTPYSIPVYAVSQPGGANAAATLYGFTAGTDGLQRVDNLTFTMDANSTWTADANYQAAQAMFPPDAVYVQDVQDPTLGVIHIYRSASLGATLPASAFANAQGGPAWPAGTFSVTCNVPGQQLCTVMTGT